MVSSVTASCNVKKVSFFFLSIVKIIEQILLFCFKIDVLQPEFHPIITSSRYYSLSNV